jgi:glycosyltransferase involved in cell wall biosynthesis
LNSIRICRIVTVPLTFQTLLFEQLRYLSDRGLNLTLVSNPEDGLIQTARKLKLPYCAIQMARAPDPVKDLSALASMIRLFSKERFDIVHSVTPKAGLLTALAGFLTRIPIRVHTYTGQVWFEKKGFARKLFKSFDWLIGKLNPYCYTDSSSQSEFLIKEKVITPSKIAFLGSGSIGGVDLRRFDPQAFGPAGRISIRKELGIADDALVILFVGRLTRDKGIGELASAFSMIQKRRQDVELLLVGPSEPERDPLADHTIKELSRNPNIHSIGFSDTPEKYMAAADIFCLPSYREGFGSVVVEAAAMGLPAVATRVVGLVDAVVEEKTGLLVPSKDSVSLSKALMKLLSDPEMRLRMGNAGRIRAIREFDASLINQLVYEEYRNICEKANL